MAEQIRTVRVYIDFPIGMYQALVQVCERLQCTIAVLVIRLATTALQGGRPQAEPPATVVRDERWKQRALSAEKSLGTARTTIDGLRATTRTMKTEALAELRAAEERLVPDARENELALRRANRRIERMTAKALAERDTLRATQRYARRLERELAKRPTPIRAPRPAVPRSSAPMTEVDLILVARLHNANAAISQIAAGLSISVPRARQAVEQLGLPIPHKGPRSRETIQAIAALIAERQTPAA